MQEEKLKKGVVSLAGSGRLGKCGSLAMCPRMTRFIAAHRKNIDRKACNSFGYSPCAGSSYVGIGYGRGGLFRVAKRRVGRLIVPRRGRNDTDLIISRSFFGRSLRIEQALLENVSTLVAGIPKCYIYIAATSYMPILLCSEELRIITTIRTN